MAELLHVIAVGDCHVFLDAVVPLDPHCPVWSAAFVGVVAFAKTPDVPVAPWLWIRRPPGKVLGGSAVAHIVFPAHEDQALFPLRVVVINTIAGRTDRGRRHPENTRFHIRLEGVSTVPLPP